LMRFTSDSLTCISRRSWRLRLLGFFRQDMTTVD